MLSLLSHLNITFIKAYLLTVPFIQYIIFGYEEKKLKGILKGKARFKVAEPELKANSDMAEMLKLSSLEFKTTMINMLKSLFDNIDNI